jgi:hypothetical protein
VIVHERRIPPTKAQRDAARHTRWAPILTAVLLCTAAIALSLALDPQTQGTGATWWLAGYAIAAALWGGGRVVNTAAVTMEETP